MKPSERRALREQQNISQDEENQENSIEMDTPKEDNQATQETKYETKYEPRHEKNVKTSKEGFVSSHIRIITFIVCISLFLIFMGPWSIYRLQEKFSNKDVTDKENITMNYVYGLSDKGGNVVWSDFKDFNYADQSYDTNSGVFIKREYQIAKTNYMLWVGGRGNISSPEYVYLINEDTGKQINILDKKAQDFVEGQTEEDK